MSHTPHTLADEFPEDADVIHDLKTSNSHFAKLAEEYHEINREIHRIEADIAPTSDEALTELRKRRLALVDEIAGFIRSAKAA